MLPVAIIYSRTGYEVSHAPLYTLVLIFFAYRLRTRFVAALLLCAYFVHPTNIFILPVLLALVVVRSLQQSQSGERASGWRLIRCVWPMCLVVVALGVFTLSRPTVNGMSAIYHVGLHSPHDPGVFLRRLGRFYLGLGNIVDSGIELAMLAGVGALTAIAMVRQFRQRRWEPLALIGGTLLSVSGLFVLGGSNILQPGMTRYGLFLVTPGVLSLACVADALVVIPRGFGVVVRVAYAAGALALGWAMALSMRLERITPQRVLAEARPASVVDREVSGPWSHPAERVLALIDAERVRERAGRITRGQPGIAGKVLVSDGMQTSVLQYLAQARDDLVVVDLLKLDRDPDHWFPRLRNLVARGAFAVGVKGGFLEMAMETVLPPSRLARRTIPNEGSHCLLFYHLRSDILPMQPVPGDFDGDGQSDLALHQFESSEWLVRPTAGTTVSGHLGPPGQGIPAPADFDGDGRTDLAIYLPEGSAWLIQQSSEGLRILASGDGYSLPVPGDYDGDGRAEAATFVTVTARWSLPGRSPFEFGRGQRFGGTPVPVPADYDGDGRTDVAVFEVGDASWSIEASREGRTAFQFGPPNAVPVPGDYDGDGRADPAVFDPATGDWFLRCSSGGNLARQLGPPGSVPVPGDHDGDGRTDLVTFDPTTGLWRLRASSSAEKVVELGRILGSGQASNGLGTRLLR